MIYLPNLIQIIRQKPLYNQNKASIKNISKSVFLNKTTHFSTLQHSLSMLDKDPICIFYNEYCQMLTVHCWICGGSIYCLLLSFLLFTLMGSGELSHVWWAANWIFLLTVTDQDGQQVAGCEGEPAHLRHCLTTGKSPAGKTHTWGMHAFPWSGMCVCVFVWTSERVALEPVT